MCRQAAARANILNGWEEIANYLGKGVRTVQRYESELRLPVRRRRRRKSGGSVFASKAELDGWVIASPIREVFRLPYPTVDKASTLEEFRRHIEELRRLREEAAQLRGELRVSLQVLRASIQALSEQQDPPSSPERRLLADVLRFDLSKRKVR